MKGGKSSLADRWLAFTLRRSKLTHVGFKTRWGKLFGLHKEAFYLGCFLMVGNTSKGRGGGGGWGNSVLLWPQGNDVAHSKICVFFY